MMLMATGDRGEITRSVFVSGAYEAELVALAMAAVRERESEPTATAGTSSRYPRSSPPPTMASRRRAPRATATATARSITSSRLMRTSLPT